MKNQTLIYTCCPSCECEHTHSLTQHWFKLLHFFWEAKFQDCLLQTINIYVIRKMKMNQFNLKTMNFYGIGHLSSSTCCKTLEVYCSLRVDCWLIVSLFFWIKFKILNLTQFFISIKLVCFHFSFHFYSFGSVVMLCSFD
jgi:hypothetical protein